MTNDSPTSLTQLLNDLNLTPEEKVRSDWARKSKSSFLTYTMRVFEHRTTHKLMAVLYDAARDCYYTQFLLGPLCGSSGPEIKKRLLEALKDVKHGGDYGYLHYLANPATAWLVLGDSDGDMDEGHTSFEDIKEKLLATGLVTTVYFADEAFPPLPGDTDFDEKFTYINFGKFGTVV